MQNKKVRIISFQNAQNYGAILQAFALQKVIEGFEGVDVKFINYNPKYLKKRYRVLSIFNNFTKYSLKIKLKFALTIPLLMINRIRRNSALCKSREKLLRQTQKEFHYFEEIQDEQCEYLICGSDQIWSTWITHTPDPAFYGAGNYKNLKRTIAYAPSSEMSTFQDKEQVNKIKELLRNFDAISVREESIKKEIEKITNKPVGICVDPTILCGVKPFSDVASPRMVSKPYILVYAYNSSDKLIRQMIQSVPSTENYEVHYLTFGSTGLSGIVNKCIHSEAGIEEFLSLFKYSSYVVTNSFHGLAFSLLFEKPFNVGYVEGISGRVESLLKQLNLSNRLIKDTKDLSWENINFMDVKEKLSIIRSHSLSFLQDNIN